MIGLLILIIGTASGYDFKCPAKAEWRLRAKISCYSEYKYACLFNLLEEKYMENCSKTDQSSIGSQLVFQPLFNLAECNAERYQPIVFTTHGNSECIYSKSKCTEEGQVVFSNDSTSADVSCRCDYTKGYAFVTKPKNSCFCKPSEEDCSCVRVTCTNLTRDYQCVTDGEIMMNSTCQEILPNIPYNTEDNMVQLIESYIQSYSNAHYAAYIIVASIIAYFVFAAIVLLKLCVFVPPRILSQEMIDSDGRNICLKYCVSSHLPLTSVIWYREPGDSISPDIKSYNGFSLNGIRILTIDTHEKDDFATYKCIVSNIIGAVEGDPVQPNDDEKQKFIHELFLKGECGKLHFARLVLIGKNGVGKTSLMRRLLWHNKEDVTTTQSTDGIEVEKCNINIADGKWSPCNNMIEVDDDLTRLIHQVYKKKSHIIDCATEENVVDQETLPNTDESRSESGKTLFKRSDHSDTLEIESNERHDTVGISNSRADNEDSHVEVDIDSNQMQPDNSKLKPMHDKELNTYTNGTDFDYVNDEKINQMTSSIMKSYFQLREEDHNDMFGFCWLWDFAGQKDFYATHQVFLSKYAVYLLVTDSLEFSTNENHGIDYESSAQHVSFWFDAIHCYRSTTKGEHLNPPIIVVCTNEDQFKEPSERKNRHRQFKDNIGEVLKDQKKEDHLRNIHFISNTEDSFTVLEKIRKEISSHAMDMKDWGRDCPLKWLLFQQVLLKLKYSNVPISSTKTLLKIAKHEDIDISDDNEVKECLQYFHDIGTIVYFDEEKLADYVILDPKWLINAFRCLVSDKIDTVIEVSNDWLKLKDTGELTDSLISRLFQKEPKLKFEVNKQHLLEVMKRFDIIVNLNDSTKLYMPCMIKSGSFSDIQKQFYDRRQSIYKTSWLCLVFEFLPPAFFNHIIARYIETYNVSVIIDEESQRNRNALYRKFGVFDLNSSSCEQIVVCEGPNTIALQVWDSRMSSKTYGNLGSELFRFVETLQLRYSLQISYKISFTCKNGNFTVNRKAIEELVTKEYRCLEHKANHLSDDLLNPWNYSRKLQIAYLLMKIAPRAVRKKFDLEFDPVTLQKFLRDNRSKIDELTFRKRILTRTQYQILYPKGSSEVSSDIFDVSLMVCLLRHFTDLDIQDSLPLDTIHTTDADISRIQFYRNFIVHSYSGQLNENKYSKIWYCVVQAILRLAPDLQLDIASLMSSPLTDSDSDMTDLRQLEKTIEKTNQHLHAIN